MCVCVCVCRGPVCGGGRAGPWCVWGVGWGGWGGEGKPLFSVWGVLVVVEGQLAKLAYISNTGTAVPYSFVHQ